MKKTVLMIAAALCVAAFAVWAIASTKQTTKKASGEKDAQGHVLVQMWKDYEAAAAKGLPRKQSAILEQIQATSIAEGYSWDWYDAARKNVQVVSSMNWKLRDSITRCFKDGVASYPDPIVRVQHALASGSRAGDVSEIASAARKQLLSQSSEAFWDDSTVSRGRFYKVIRPGLKNDYEYALWAMLGRFGYSYVKESDRESMKSFSAGMYPQEAILEFCQVQNAPYSDRKSSFEDFEKKYAGKAVGFLASSELVSMEKTRIDNNSPKDVAAYKALYDRCLAYEKVMKDFSSSEPEMLELCSAIRGIREQLGAKSARCNIDDGRACIIVKNCPEVTLAIYDSDEGGARGKKRFSKTVKNSEKSFYVPDTLYVDIPQDFDDGCYEAVVVAPDKVEETCGYDRYSLSLSTRRDSKGVAVCVVDAKSGRPCGDVVLTAAREGKKASLTQQVSCEKGYVYLSEGISRALTEDRQLHIAAKTGGDGTRLRLSRSVWLFRSVLSVSDDRLDGKILTDCAAFNPGETLRFKAIAYKNSGGVYSTFAEGEKLSVSLRDAAGSQVGSLTAKTDGFGAVAGEFALPVDKKNGMWEMTLEYKGEYLDYRRVRVDEFVLPSYDLAFDQIDKLISPGDTVNIAGKVCSYSGHSLSSAQLRWTVYGGKQVLSGRCTLSDSGRFGFSFPTEQSDSYRWATYNVEVTVVDVTGETLEFSKSVHVRPQTWTEVSLVGVEDGVFDGDTLRAAFRLNSSDGVNVERKVKWILKRNGDNFAEGQSVTGASVDIPLAPGAAAYVFSLDGEPVSESFFKMTDEDTVADAPSVNVLCRKMDRDGISFQIAQTDGPAWVFAELYGRKSELLRSEIVYLGGVRGESSSIAVRSYEYVSSYPDDVTLVLRWFRKYSTGTKIFNYVRSSDVCSVPLSVSRMTDNASPSSSVEVSLKTSSEAQCAVAVFDKSTERILANRWDPVCFSVKQSESPSYNDISGTDRSSYRIYASYDGGTAVKSVAKMSNRVYAEGSVEVVEEAMDLQRDVQPADDVDVEVRSDFQTSLAFEPFLTPDKDGNVNFSFKTSGKLSTYIMNVFAHDKGMRNASVRNEIVVTLPIEVSLAQPSFLHEGDVYCASASVSSTLDRQLAGVLTMTASYGDRTVANVSKRMEIGAGASSVASLNVEVPSGVDSLDLLVRFVSDVMPEGRSFSDAIKVMIPVRPRVQPMVESYSEVMLAGADRDAALERLLASFVNTTSDGAQIKDITVRDMVEDAIIDRQDSRSDNAIALVDALYCNQIASSLRGHEGSFVKADPISLVKLLDCRNSDGGFGWFKGFSSSPYVTAVVLMRLASLRERGLLPDGELSATMTKAVRYLDSSMMPKSKCAWYSSLSENDYMYVRSFYPEVSMDVALGSDFRKYARSYLVPKKYRGTSGPLGKAYRLLTLANLYNKEGGLDLARKWGVSVAAKSKIAASAADDMASLSEYAVKHRNGSIYFPNAVMPFRGLMTTELYAHSLLCDLFRRYSDGEFSGAVSSYAVGSAREIADGLALWLMIQKETQAWNGDPACLEAISSVLSSSDEVLATKVLTVSKSFQAKVEEIKATGNGMRLERAWYREGSSKALSEGDTLTVGEKIVAKYRIWNEENRSFIKLTVPFPACLRPVNQLSSNMGSCFRPVIRGIWSYSSQGYRTSRYDRSEYWYDLLPEENTEISEEFFVTQNGRFASEIPVIESVYAPHYRANTAWEGEMYAR